MRPRASDIPRTGRVLGLDVGDVRLGVAVSDPGQVVATPDATLSVDELTDGAPDDVAALAAGIAAVAAQREVVGIVLGLPRNLDGREGRAARHARRVGAAVAQATGLPIDWIDERFTSVEAERAMAARGHDSRARRGRVDEVAASLILRTWLESRR